MGPWQAPGSNLIDNEAPFETLPRRIFLDSCTAQTLRDYGGFIYEDEPITETDRMHRVPDGLANLDALRNPFLVSERALFEWIVSEDSLREAHDKRDSGHMRWLALIDQCNLVGPGENAASTEIARGATVQRACERSLPKLRGLEIDPGLATLSRRLLKRMLHREHGLNGARIPKIVRRADSLAIELRDRYDLIVGNPPYGKVGRAAGMKLGAMGGLANLGGHTNLYGLFLLRALDWLRPGGGLVDNQTPGTRAVGPLGGRPCPGRPPTMAGDPH
jgi:hypothetical protein